MVVEAEVDRMRRFGVFFVGEDRKVFEDLILQCKLYAPYASNLASTIKEVPLMMSMLFAQHKKLLELDRRTREIIHLLDAQKETPQEEATQNPQTIATTGGSADPQTVQSTS